MSVLTSNKLQNTMLSTINTSRLMILLLPILMTAGCSALWSTEKYQSLQNLNHSTDTNTCDEFIRDLDQQIQDQHQRDPEYQLIFKRPWLRHDRFLASFNPAIMGTEERQTWLEQAFEMGQKALIIESSRLKKNTAKINDESAHEGALNEYTQRIRSCSEYLFHIERERLITALDYLQPHVPDNYSFWQRTVGLYPITSKLAKGAIGKYRQEMQAWLTEGVQFGDTFTTYMPERYDRLEAKEIAPLLASAYQDNILGIPVLSTENQQRLLQHYAPILKVNWHSANDYVGRFEAISATDYQLNTEHPASYTYLSYTRLNGEILLQLNYQFWFPSRPPEKKRDPYAGHLDGIIWRATLNTEGQVLWYDTIHPCGCYHTIFPVAEGWHLKTPVKVEMPLWGNQAPDALTTPIQIEVRNDDHYVLKVSEFHADPNELKDTQRQFPLLPYDDLKQLSWKSGAISLFNKRGLVKSSVRLERFTLWPFGVPSAGAMRQRGTHAIAFIGKRHFDDPYLFAEILTPR